MCSLIWNLCLAKDPVLFWERRENGYGEQLIVSATAGLRVYYSDFIHSLRKISLFQNINIRM
jgi:hypothetical protein